LQQASFGACCVAVVSSHAPELAIVTQQALTLRSLLLQRSKLSRSGAKKLRSLLRFSKQAPEPDKLRSLLRCSSKRSRSGGYCCNAASFHALELVALQQASSGGCCYNATSFGAGQAPEFVALQQQAVTLRSLLLQCSKLRSRTSSGAYCVAGFSCSKQAPEPRSSGEASELGACLPLQTKQTKIK